MQKSEIKDRVLKIIDQHRSEIIKVGEEIYQNPELGYKENKTTEIMAAAFAELDLDYQYNQDITGINAQLTMQNSGPCLAVLGELDAVTCAEHPDADPETKAIHACGHNVQSSVMYGVALALKKAGLETELSGSIKFISTPAEEFIELAYRDQLKESGKISFFGGKQELVKRGYFDQVDLAVMMHSLNLEDKKALIGPKGNGFIGKKIRIKGQESHAGSAPEKGINALNAAVLAINNINAQRETFTDEDRVRVHPIITKGGDIVNIVPADVHLESYVRARNISAMKNANRKVNRALKAGALAVGAEIEIKDIPGYLPLLNNQELDQLLQDNLLDLESAAKITVGGDFTGSFDFGDISHLMPVLHPFFGGVTGDLHTRNFKIIDPETAYILPVKALAMTIIDLLFKNAETARQVINNHQPVLTKTSYLELLNSFSETDNFTASELD